MIRFKKIKWKNFLSTGDQWTEVKLNDDGTTLIVGANGAGKSTVLDAICFVLFNKPYRKITKSQLVNTTNEKGTETEIEFEIGSKQYLVRRGIKPNIFDIEIDGGINFENCKVAIDAGANILVSGTTVFKSNDGDIKKNIDLLKLK